MRLCKLSVLLFVFLYREYQVYAAPRTTEIESSPLRMLTRKLLASLSEGEGENTMNEWNPPGLLWKDVKFWTNIEEEPEETFPVDEGFMLVPKTTPKPAEKVEGKN